MRNEPPFSFDVDLKFKLNKDFGSWHQTREQKKTSSSGAMNSEIAENLINFFHSSSALENTKHNYLVLP